MSTQPFHQSPNKSLISNHYLRASVSGAMKQGALPEQLLAQAGIPIEWLDDPEQLITDQHLSALIKTVWRVTDDEFMGLSPSPSKRGVFSLMAELAHSAKSLGGALEQSARFYTAVADDLKIRLDAHTSEQQPLVFYQLHLQHAGEDQHHMLQEFIMLMWQRFSSWMIGHQVPIARTCFAYPAPEHVQEYQAMYLGEILYNQPTCGFYLHPRFLQLPIIRDKSELQVFLHKSPGIILHRPVADTSIQRKTRLFLQQFSLDNMPELEEISRYLLLTPRTLRRKLNDEGITIRQIKEDLRRDFALNLLAGEHLSIQEIAEQSGFSEAASFCRSFKRWTGSSPAQWRVRT